MIYSIYKITCIVNNKVYIGYTQNPKGRWKGHINHKTSYKNSKLYRAMDKHGNKNFTFEVIYQSKDKHHCKEIMEPLLIEYYDAINSGYNIAKGGSGGATRTGMLWDQHTKDKIAASVTASFTNEMKDAVSKRRKGVIESKETRDKQSSYRKQCSWVSNESTFETRFVNQTDAKILLDNGWIKGRKFNNAFVKSGTNFRS